MAAPKPTIAHSNRRLAAPIGRKPDRLLRARSSAEVVEVVEVAGIMATG